MAKKKNPKLPIGFPPLMVNKQWLSPKTIARNFEVSHKTALEWIYDAAVEINAIAVKLGDYRRAPVRILADDFERYVVTKIVTPQAS